MKIQKTTHREKSRERTTRRGTKHPITKHDKMTLHNTTRLKTPDNRATPGETKRQNSRSHKPVHREQILSALVRALEPLDYVHAMSEGGAIGHGRLDQWSDIDLYIDAQDERVHGIFRVVERALESVSPIDIRYEVPTTPAQGYEQAFYRLKGTSKFLLIDLAVFRHSAENKFLEAEIHGKIYFCFNKNNIVKCSPLDREKLLDTLKSRLERIQSRFSTFECFVQKEINRKNWIEALDLYRGLVLDSLVEVLRIKLKPVRYQFKTRYINYDLPPGVVNRLKKLHFVRDEKDLGHKYRVAKRWFHETVRGVNLEEIERALKSTER